LQLIKTAALLRYIAAEGSVTSLCSKYLSPFNVTVMRLRSVSEVLKKKTRIFTASNLEKKNPAQINVNSELRTPKTWISQMGNGKLLINPAGI